MKLVKYAVLALLALPLVAALVLWIGGTMALDRSGSYTSAVQQLPLFAPASSQISVQEPLAEGRGKVRIQANGYEFVARVAGFGAEQGRAGNVVLLHGFPETSRMWEPLIDALAAADYRVVAFDQRGYSPGARPEGVSDYLMPQLIGDLVAVAQAVGFETYHLVGHDWGSAVGWSATMALPANVQTYNALSIPHVFAFGAAMQDENSEQRSKSAYMGFFATPWLPEQVFAFDDFDVMRGTLYSEHPPAVVDDYLAMFAEPGALTGALNWYRASALPAAGGGGDELPEDSQPQLNPIITKPVQFIWGSNDAAVSAEAVALQAQYLKGPYEEITLDAGHWLMEEQTELVVAKIVGFIREHSSG